MTIEYDEPPTVEDLLEAQDLLALAKAGLQPPVGAWIDAPMITDYREFPARSYADEGMIEIQGLIFGHPYLPGGTLFRTNALIFGDHGSRFVCTLRGYYRLGAPARSELN